MWAASRSIYLLTRSQAVILSQRRDFIAVCSKPHQTAAVSAVCIQGTRHLATVVGPVAWCLERRSLGVKRDKQGMEWGNGGREGEQRKGGASSAWPLPLSSAAGGMCDCRSRSPLKSQIIRVWISSGFLSYIHWKEMKSSYTPVIVRHVIPLMPCFVANMSSIF